MAKKSLCSIPKCGKPIQARRWCRVHYQQWLMHGDPLADNSFHGDPKGVINYLENFDLERCGDRIIATLTDKDVLAIRSLHGVAQLSVLAQMFGVTQNTIRSIHSGKA